MIGENADAVLHIKDCTNLIPFIESWLESAKPQSESAVPIHYYIELEFSAIMIKLACGPQLILDALLYEEPGADTQITKAYEHLLKYLMQGNPQQ